MPTEGIVCCIVFPADKTIWFGEKIKSLFQLLRKLCYFFHHGQLAFFVPNKSFKNENSTSAKIVLWSAIHAQSKEQHIFSAKTCRTTLILQTKY